MNAGITFKLFRKVAVECNEDHRLKWKEDVNTHFIVLQIVFIDETSKDNWTIYCHYGHSVVGHRATITTNFMQGDWFSMVAALSLGGYDTVRVVEGSFDREDFLDFITNDVVHCVVHFTSLDFY